MTAGQHQWWRECWFPPFSQKFATVFCLSSEALPPVETAGPRTWSPDLRNQGRISHPQECGNQPGWCTGLHSRMFTALVSRPDTYHSLLVTMEGGPSYYTLLPQPSLEVTLWRDGSSAWWPLWMSGKFWGVWVTAVVWCSDRASQGDCLTGSLYHQQGEALW